MNLSLRTTAKCEQSMLPSWLWKKCCCYYSLKYFPNTLVRDCTALGILICVSTEERFPVPMLVQMLNPVRSKWTAPPLLHLAAATSLSTSSLQQFCHGITVIDGTTYSLAHQGWYAHLGQGLQTGRICRLVSAADVYKRWHPSL